MPIHDLRYSLILPSTDAYKQLLEENTQKKNNIDEFYATSTMVDRSWIGSNEEHSDKASSAWISLQSEEHNTIPVSVNSVVQGVTSTTSCSVPSAQKQWPNLAPKTKQQSMHTCAHFFFISISQKTI
ncbi:hypothetical protein ANN_00475 [Periplaneta americana]|uniref:Uncharacterized protein n=1 Tax=Periplaneta americana TaxID=6978 RepID=A0ABQ8TQY1_PERAM|nr:hypothetical protein ANN_00475 [Periplaneta americana]